MQHVIIGSRGSDLALWQANHVKTQLEEIGCSVEINIIKTQGDKIQNLSFDKLEGKGFFTKEIEEALLNKKIDLAVHSHKDLETTPPEGLMIAAVSERENPSDLLLIKPDAASSGDKWGLKKTAVVGTSSARRKSQLIDYRPDLIINDLRGNVPTRINKLREGNYDAIVLAKAGVDRLKIDLSEFKVVVLDPEEFVPAPAQGVLGLQIREGDDGLLEIMKKLNHPEVAVRIELERKVLNLLDGGCQLPLGAFCSEDRQLYISYAEKVEDQVQRKKYSINDFQGMAETVVADLTNNSN